MFLKAKNLAFSDQFPALDQHIFKTATKKWKTDKLTKY